MLSKREQEIRKETIRRIVPNLRHRWPTQLVEFTDNQIASVYENFSQSEDHGNNDEKFPEWFIFISLADY